MSEVIALYSAGFTLTDKRQVLCPVRGAHISNDVCARCNIGAYDVSDAVCPICGADKLGSDSMSLDLTVGFRFDRYSCGTVAGRCYHDRYGGVLSITTLIIGDTCHVISDVVPHEDYI